MMAAVRGVRILVGSTRQPGLLVAPFLLLMAACQQPPSRAAETDKAALVEALVAPPDAGIRAPSP
jgi:hypothetical protein